MGILFVVSDVDSANKTDRNYSGFTAVLISIAGVPLVQISD